MVYSGTGNMQDLKIYVSSVLVRCFQYPSKYTGKLLSYNLCKNFSLFKRKISFTFNNSYSLKIGSVCDLYVLFVTTRMAVLLEHGNVLQMYLP